MKRLLKIMTFLPLPLLGLFACVMPAPQIAAPQMAAPSPPPAMDQETFARLAAEWARSNPEVIAEALRADEARQLAEREQRMNEIVASMRDEILASGAPVHGTGEVTLVEFLDYRCGYCRSVYADVQAVAETAPGVRVQYQDLPVLGEPSERLARLALAAQDQGLYVAAHRALMDGDAEAFLAEGGAARLAAEIGADAAALASAAEAADTMKRLDASRALAAQLEIYGTPAFLAIGPSGAQIAPGALDQDTLKALAASVR